MKEIFVLVLCEFRGSLTFLTLLSSAAGPKGKRFRDTWESQAFMRWIGGGGEHGKGLKTRAQTFCFQPSHPGDFPMLAVTENGYTRDAGGQGGVTVLGPGGPVVGRKKARSQP